MEPAKLLLSFFAKKNLRTSHIFNWRCLTFIVNSCKTLRWKILSSGPADDINILSFLKNLPGNSSILFLLWGLPIHSTYIWYSRVLLWIPKQKLWLFIVWNMVEGGLKCKYVCFKDNCIDTKLRFWLVHNFNSQFLLSLDPADLLGVPKKSTSLKSYGSLLKKTRQIMIHWKEEALTRYQVCEHWLKIDPNKSYRRQKIWLA